MERMEIAMTSKIGNLKEDGRPSTNPAIRQETGDRRQNRNVGFTLLELVAVIAIISLLVLLGLPVLSKFGSNTRLKSAANQIAALLRLAKNLSTTRNVACTVSIYPRDMTDGNRIYVVSGSSQVEKIWVAPPLVEIPDVSGASGARQNIQFNSYGTADAKSIHIIQKGTLVNGSAYSPSGSYGSLGKAERVKCYTVTTDNNTGRAQIYYYGRNSPWASTDL